MDTPEHIEKLYREALDLFFHSPNPQAAYGPMSKILEHYNDAQIPMPDSISSLYLAMLVNDTLEAEAAGEMVA